MLPLLAILAGCNAIPGGPAAPRDAPRRAASPVFPDATQRQCLGQLGAANAAFTPLPDQYFGAGCATTNTVRLTSLRSDGARLDLANLGPVSCPLASTFAGWARYGVDRAAMQWLGSPLARIETMGSYNCRNVAGSGRRSAHATANAIDISGFVLADGRRITISGDWNSPDPRVRQFLSAIHTSACRRFGTVLSPRYNPAHEDHLHLELGGRAFCR